MTQGTIYTIGYGGRAPAQLVETLAKHHIRCLADVRLRPQRASMGAYVKAKSSERGIEKLLTPAGIRYVWLEELGNPFLDNPEHWRMRYEQLIDSEGATRTARLLELEQPFALMCAEKNPSGCHRTIIAAFMERHGWTVEHL